MNHGSFINLHWISLLTLEYFIALFYWQSLSPNELPSGDWCSRTRQLDGSRLLVKEKYFAKCCNDKAILRLVKGGTGWWQIPTQPGPGKITWWGRNWCRKPGYFQVPELAFVFILFIFFYNKRQYNTLNIVHCTAVSKHIMHSLYSHIREKNH